jgi:hypothetical protein
MAARRGLLLGGVIVVLAVSNLILWSALKNARERTKAAHQTHIQGEGEYLKVRQAFGGRSIAHVVGLRMGSVPALSGGSPTLVVVVRTLECPTCFEFHADHIRRLHAEYRIQVFGVGSGSYETLLGRAFPFSVAVNEIDHKMSPTSIGEGKRSVDFAILFINEHGQILYVDIPDQANYSRSETFYAVLRSYLASRQLAP